MDTPGGGFYGGRRHSVAPGGLVVRVEASSELGARMDSRAERGARDGEVFVSKTFPNTTGPKHSARR
jgi:hypothetical protein